HSFHPSFLRLHINIVYLSFIWSILWWHGLWRRLPFRLLLMRLWRLPLELLLLLLWLSWIVRSKIAHNSCSLSLCELVALSRFIASLQCKFCHLAGGIFLIIRWISSLSM